MATPHCAMAHCGSLSEISVKTCRACSYWKECSSATARLKLPARSVRHEVRKWTEPTCSSMIACWCPSWLSASGTKHRIDARTAVLGRIGTSVWGPIVQPIGTEKALGWLGGPASDDSLHAPTASCPPSGKKYCVPLMGSVTFRNSSCKSSLRSTKSMSDVLTISRSDDV